MLCVFNQLMYKDNNSRQYEYFSKANNHKFNTIDYYVLDYLAAYSIPYNRGVDKAGIEPRMYNIDERAYDDTI